MVKKSRTEYENLQIEKGVIPELLDWFNEGVSKKDLILLSKQSKEEQQKILDYLNNLENRKTIPSEEKLEQKIKDMIHKKKVNDTETKILPRGKYKIDWKNRTIKQHFGRNQWIKK